LNTAVMKLREALDDSAETPLYIETVPKRGYRFIAPLASQPDTAGTPANQDSEFVVPTGNDRGQSEPREGQAAPIAALTLRRGGSYARVAVAFVVVLITVAAFIVLNVRGWRDRLMSRPPQIRALAVLPFTNLSEDPQQEYFSDGLTEALITELGRMGGPRIISRQSIMQFKGSQKPMDQIARELKVDAVLEGAVGRSGDRVRITVHLAQGNPERQLWAEQYDRDIRDVLAVQGEIARSVANQIRAKLSAEETRNIATRRAVNPEAHAEYLQGLYDFWISRNPDKSTNPERAIEHFRKAIDKDPTFAPAHAGLAIAYFWLAHIGGPPPLARAAASQAAQLDPSLPEAHFALSLLSESDDEAAAQLKEALRLNPSYAECYRIYGARLEGQGRTDEAIAKVRLAIELDPLNTASQNQLGVIALTSRNYAQAITIFESLHESAWFGSLAQAYIAQGRFSDAFTALDKCGSSDSCLMVRAWAYGQVGRRQDAAQILARLKGESSQRYVYPAVFMIVYASLGDKDQALNWLERAYEEKEPWLFWLKVHPMVDPLRGEPRFQAVLRKVYPQ
jgi:TolB-like protein/Flp pilus assembly protein TadD